MTKQNNQKKRSNNPINIATDLVSGVFVGFWMGFYLDKWLDTKPLFMIICLLLGMAAALRMIFREMK
ncbi:MAG: putative F0F1-ATPase subunit Ca2+/Mg2+ transporter [Pseudomonadota bacterium]|jgi:ATP synthase protein I